MHLRNAGGAWKGSNSLNRNFTNPSNVCARPEMVVPTAAKAVVMTPTMALITCWNTAMIEARMDPIAEKMDEMNEEMLSTREGILVVIWIGYC